MKNIKKTLSTLVLTAAVVATAQTVNATTIMTGDTGLGQGLGGAVINSTDGGFVGCDLGDNSASLNFNGSSVVNWNTLNLNSGETLNFNTVDGTNGITVLNTVQSGISNIYGDINADNGISHLIISNPNGMLFDGCHFTAGGEVTLTATPVSYDLENDKFELKPYTKDELPDFNPWNPGYTNVKIQIKNYSDFSVGGNFNIVAPGIRVWDSKVSVGDGKGTFKLETVDGYNFITGGLTGNETPGAGAARDENPRTLVGATGINLQAIEVDGNVEIVVPNRGALVSWHRGGNITGDLNIDSNDCVAINMYRPGQLTVGGDVNIVANGDIASVNQTDVGGNMSIYNKSGIVEVKNVNVGNDLNLKTDAQRKNRSNVKSEIWMDGENTVGGNVFMNAIHNILIGNNRGEKSSLTAGGDVNAHAQDGHVMVTSDVTAGNNISLRSDNLNILTDGEAVLSAKTYDFYSNGYIGGLGTCIVGHGAESQDLRSVVENYTFVPSLNVFAEGGILYADDTFNNYRNNGALIVNGGTITNLDANYVKMDSLGDLTIEHANIGEDMRISAIDSHLDLSSEDIHADVIYVGDKTESLTIAEKARDFVTSFFSVRFGDRHAPSAIRPDETLTGELADMYNTPKEGLERAADTTLINGKAAPVPVEPTVDPVNPVDPSTVDASDNVKTLNSMNNDLLSQATDAAPVNTPTAYAADLDEDDNTSAPIRQNVDGSVTIVKEMIAD